MSLIHDQSCECSVSPLEWFRILPTQTAVEKTSDVEYQSLTSLKNNAPVEFYIPASTDDYLDLKNSKLFLSFRIIQNDHVMCNDDNIVAPINDIFNGLWSNVELFMNDRLISHSNNTHGYTSMISHLIHDSEESLHSERSLRLLYKDTAGQMDHVNATDANMKQLIKGFHMMEKEIVLTENNEASREIPFDVAHVRIENPGNYGLHQRFLFTRTSKKVSVMGSLRIDMFEQERYLPNGVSLKLRFHRQREPFTMMSADGAVYKLDLEEAYMLIRKVKTSPGVQLGHAESLMKMPAKFPITRKECKVMSLSKDVNTFVKDNIFLGQLPKRVVIGMVDNQAFAGSFQLNPYNFQHMNVNFMQLYSDGEPVLSQPLKPSIADGDYLQCYETLYRGFDRLDGSRSSIIKREDWDKGYSLFAFDLTPDYDDDDHYPIIKHGNLRLEINFTAAITKPINIIVYAEFDNIVEITGNRNIQMDYT